MEGGGRRKEEETLEMESDKTVTVTFLNLMSKSKLNVYSWSFMQKLLKCTETGCRSKWFCL